MRKFTPSKFKQLIAICLCFVLGSLTSSFGQQTSPLQQGNWLKIAITQSQFYHLNQAWFTKHHITGIEPSKIRIYGVQAGMLNPIDDPQIGSLKVIPTTIQQNSLHAWEVLFWGDSPHELKQTATWAQETHLYSDSTFYFVQIDATQSNPIQEINPKSASGPALPFAYGLKNYEPETYNLLQSGQLYLGDAFYGNSTKYLQYSFNDYAEGHPSYLDTKFYASSISASTFQFPGLNKSITLSPVNGGRYDTKASSEIFKTWLRPTPNAKSWTLPIQFQSSGGTGYIDYVRLVYPRQLDASQANPLYLLPNKSDSTMHIAFANLKDHQQIWINNGGKSWNKVATNKSFELTFQTNSRLAIADLNTAAEPIFCGYPTKQFALNVPATTEMIIISSPALSKEAEKLANYKSAQRHIPSSSMTTSAIYQDFSGGKQDVTAIRNFIRFQYQKNGSKLKYVILLGDASIDYKGQNIVSTALEKSCFVPTYQSAESLQPLLSYASDDFYGIMDTNSLFGQEGEQEKKTHMQVSIGRIPVKNPQEANMFIHKLMDYESKSRTRATQFAWLADDGDANIHMQDAEDFSKLLRDGFMMGQQHKVFLDQYPMQQANGVYTSPLATQATLQLFDQKADFIHYTGHGSESGLADEKLITTNDLVGLKNSGNLPILLTATCQFGRFDDPNLLSGGEVSLLSDQGGAIALMSTTRPVYQSSNYLFGQAFYQNLLAKRNDSTYRLGDLFRDAKNQSQSGVINRNIQLLGDPSLTLPWSATPFIAKLDTSKQELSIINGQINSENITVQLHRVSDTRTTLGNKGLSYTYQSMSPIIWKTTGTSENHTRKFSLKNMPPLQENQAYLLNIWSTKSNISIPISRQNSTHIPDQIAPQISLKLLNESTQSSSSNPIVQVSFADSSGLVWQHTNGDLAYFILDKTTRIELAPIVQLSNGNSQLADAVIPLHRLSAGIHQIQVNCWDIYNNYSSQTFDFRVSSDDIRSIEGNLYPNPMARSFHFAFEQEKPWNRIPYQMELTNLAGQLILKRTGYSHYLDNQTGLIAFDWNEEEWKQLNQVIIFKISLLDELEREIQSFRIKTSTQ